MTDDKTLGEMSEQERTRMFDEIGAGLNAGVLDEARRGAATDRLVVVFLQLARDHDRMDERVVWYGNEHGDGEGWTRGGEVVRELLRQKLLKPGERLRCVEFNVGLELLAEELERRSEGAAP